MAEHAWTVLCRQVLTDLADDGVVSLVNVVEQLKLPEEIVQELAKARGDGLKGIFVELRFYLVSWWMRSRLDKAETLHYRVSVISPAGEVVSQQELTADLTQFASQRANIEFSQFPITILGVHYFIVEQRIEGESDESQWIPVARIPLFISS